MTHQSENRTPELVENLLRAVDLVSPAPVATQDASTASGEEIAHAAALDSDRFEVRRDPGAGDGRSEGDGAQSPVVTDAPASRAVVALLEALAMWEGTMARAVVVVDDREGSGSSATRLKLDDFADLFGEPLYQLRFVHGHKRHHRDRVDGFGSFHDLRQLVMFEVAQ